MSSKGGFFYSCGRFFGEHPSAGAAMAVGAALTIGALIFQDATTQPTAPPTAAQKPKAPSLAELCSTRRESMIAEYNAAMLAMNFEAALKAVSACANTLQDTELKSLRIKALVADHIQTIDDKKQSKEQRLWAINALKNVDLAAADKYQALEKRLAGEIRTAEKAERRKRGVSIGMSAEEVMDSSWGRPNKINQSTYSFGVHEQWVYGSGNYLYFKDGVLDSIQTSN